MAIVYPYPAYQSDTDISFPRPASTGNECLAVFASSYTENSSTPNECRNFGADPLMDQIRANSGRLIERFDCFETVFSQILAVLITIRHCWFSQMAGREQINCNYQVTANTDPVPESLHS